jgi:hypothetical protein
MRLILCKKKHLSNISSERVIFEALITSLLFTMNGSEKEWRYRCYPTILKIKEYRLLSYPFTTTNRAFKSYESINSILIWT